MNVLSLFDGMSCGQIALNRSGFKIEKYYASEVEEKPISVTQHNYPETIQLGDVRLLYGINIPEIELLMGGSPCQSFSFAGFRKGMSTKDNIEILTLEQYLHLKKNDFEFEGQSYLFWEYVRLLKEINPKYFLLENVKMTKKWKDLISDVLNVEPIEINSALVSAQNRKRLYWTNITNIEQPDDKGLLIKDIVYDDTYKVFQDERIPPTRRLTKNYVKWDLSGKKYWSQQDRAYYKNGKMCTLPHASPTNKPNIVLDLDKNLYRRLHPIEAERLQTVPDRYTDVEGVSSAQRLAMLGNGWTIDVIAHVFKNMETI